MKYFESTHCTSRAHCSTCRDKTNGTAFRESLVEKYADINGVNFLCPFGLDWGASKQTPVAPKKHKRVDFAERIQNRLYNISDSSEKAWLECMVNQCIGLMLHTPKHITCATKKAFYKRMNDKIEYYFSTYSQPERTATG